VGFLPAFVFKKTDSSCRKGCDGGFKEEIVVFVSRASRLRGLGVKSKRWVVKPRSRL